MDSPNESDVFSDELDVAIVSHTFPRRCSRSVWKSLTTQGMTLNLTDLSQCLLACIRIFKEYEQWVQYHCACHQAHRVFL